MIEMNIPKHWKIETLGQFCRVFSGYAFKTSEYVKEGIPLIKIGNLQDGTVIIGPDNDYVPESWRQRKELQRYTLKSGDMLIALTGKTGKTAVVQPSLAGSFLNQRVGKIELVSASAEQGFILAITKTRFFQDAIQQSTFRSVQGNISPSSIAQILIPLPPLPEQRAIAHVLRSIQEAKAKRQREIELERERKAALMDYLFSRGTKGESRKQTEIGEIPESWEVVRLEDVCTFTTGKLNSEKATEDGQYPFFTCSQETFRIDSYSFDQEAVLLSGNNARGIFSVKYYNGKFDAYQRTYVITVKDTKRLSYRYFLYDLFLRLEVLRRQSIGATTKYLTASIIKNLGLTLPSLSEQLLISSALWSCDEKIAVLEQEAARLDELFHAMLDELMTGKRSAVPVIDSGPPQLM